MFESIRSLINYLSENLPEFHYIDYEQKQVWFPNENFPVTLPALLIRIPKIRWKTNTKILQTGEAKLVLNCYLNSTNTTHHKSDATAQQVAYDELALVEKVHRLVEGYAQVGKWTALNRIQTRTKFIRGTFKLISITYTTFINGNPS